MDFEGLSPAERTLVETVLRGEPVDMRRQPVRAGVVRDLLLEARPGWVLPPVGARLSRAVIQGCLDLDGATVTKPVQIRHSRIEGTDGQALVIRDARLKRLGIHSSTLEGGIVGDRVDVESGLFLGGGRIIGLVQLRGGRIGGALVLEGTEFGDGKAALLAAGIAVSGPIILRKAQAAGVVSLPRSDIGAGIYAEEMQVASAALALDCESARVRGDVLLQGARLEGALRLAAAGIGGRLAASGLAVKATGEAISANGVDIGQSLELAEAKLAGSLMLEGARIAKEFAAERLDIEGGSTAIGADILSVGGNVDLARARLVGVVAMPGADIGGQLRLTEARLYGADIALRGDGGRIRGGIFLSRAMVFGLLRWPASEVGNQLRLRGAALKVDRGPALLASGTRFARDIELGEEFRTSGAVVLDQARVEGTIDLRGGRLVSSALARQQPNGTGAVTVAPSLSVTERAYDERALSLVDARVGRLQMPVVADDRPRGVVDLSRADIGSLEDYAAAWPPPASARAKSTDGRDIEHLVLDGLACAHLANPSGAAPDGPSRRGAGGSVAKARTAWLEGQAERDLVHRFKPQAWIALGERLAAQGYHDDARALSIARRRRERRAATASSGLRWQGRMLDALALYGFNPWRTVLWMVLLVLAFAGLWSWAARHCGERDCFDESVLVVTNRDAYTPERFQAVYPGFNALAYSLDLAVPFVSLGYADHWRPNVSWRPFAEMPLPDVGLHAGTPSQDSAGRVLTKPPSLTLTMGGVLYFASVIEQLLGLILGALAVTGFTGLLQKGE